MTETPGMHGQKPSLIDDVLLVLALAAALAVGMHFLDASYDDAYITYRYARNIAAGEGFVYNPGVLHLGTTTPLYTLLLALIGLIVEIPVASGLLSVASVLTAIAACEGLGRSQGIRFAGPAAAIFIVIEPQIYGIFGGETLFVQLGVLPLALLLHLRGRRRAAALLFGLAILARMDAAIFVGLVYGYAIVTTRQVPWREMGIVTAVLLPWTVWATWVLGSPLPDTLYAKMAQGAAGSWKLFFAGAIPYLTDLVPYREPLRFVFLPLLAVGIWRCLVVERVWLVFVVAALVHALAYQLVLRSSFSHWYLADAYLGHALVLGAGLRWLLIARPARMAAGAPIAWLSRGIALASVSALLVAGSGALAKLRIASPRRVIYTDLGKWLRDNTPPDASVAYFEIGYLGYFSQRTIIDPVGLVTPGGAEQIAQGRLFWFFDLYQPDYYVHNAALGGAFVDGPWFRTHYRPVRRFETRGFRGGLILYRRI